jgi:nitroreductase
MDAYDAIVARRTVRNFKSDPVPDDILKKLVNAGRLAPTGANRQPFKFLVVTDPAARDAVYQVLKWAAYIAPAGDPPPGNEPTAYVILLRDENVGAGSNQYDAGFIAENICIAAVGFDLASCVLLSFDPKKVAEYFKLPDYLIPQMVIALGYPNEFPTIVDRSDTVKYWRDENGQHIVPKKPLAEVMFFNSVKV